MQHVIFTDFRITKVNNSKPVEHVKKHFPLSQFQKY